MFSFRFINWLIFIGLSFIWGSSFILIKAGLQNLDALQVASLRIISSGLVLLPVVIRNIRNFPWQKLFVIFMSGVLGSLMPAYLFCIAEKEIDSGLAGVLNSLTPIFVIIVGVIFYNLETSFLKILGILVAFAGSVLLFTTQPEASPNNNFVYVMPIVLATLLYGINVNMVNKHLKNVSSLTIASFALVLNAIPAFVVLVITGYFSLDFSNSGILASTGYSFVLGIFGSAIASVIFYMLLKRAGAVFSSMVTYGIPLVAIFWGFIFGEQIGILQVISLFIILAGVFLANWNPAKRSNGTLQSDL